METYFAYAVTSLVVVPALTYVLMSCFRKPLKFEGKHVFITGGSQGIGLSIAQQLLQRGANVTIVARTQSKLDDAVRSLEAPKGIHRPIGTVQAIAADVTAYIQVHRLAIVHGHHNGHKISKGSFQGANHFDLAVFLSSKSLPVPDLLARGQSLAEDGLQHASYFVQVKDAIEQAASRLGVIDIAVCCAGAANTGRFVDQDISLFEQSMQLIYFGSLHVAKATLPRMVDRGEGHLLFMLSPLAAVGFVGYATYCPAKYAVRGLADVLRNELTGTGVRLSLGYPLDTDTPGFANENLTKPPETEAITRFSGGRVYSADEIAASMIKGLERDDYHIRTPETLVNLLLSSMSNITPKCYPVIVEMLLAPIVVLLQDIYRRILDRFVRRERQKGTS